jgi:hypothetical protein
MAVVQDRGVSAILAMGMVVMGVGGAAHNRLLSKRLYI